MRKEKFTAFEAERDRTGLSGPPRSKSGQTPPIGISRIKSAHPSGSERRRRVRQFANVPMADITCRHSITFIGKHRERSQPAETWRFRVFEVDCQVDADGVGLPE